MEQILIVKHLAGVVTLKNMYPPFNRHFFHNVGQWEKVSSGQGMPPDVISHGLATISNWALPGGLVFTHFLLSKTAVVCEFTSN